MHLMTLSTIKSIFRWFYVLLCLCENRYPENKFIIVFNVLVCVNESSSNRSITRSNHNIWITVDIFVCENRELISFLSRLHFYGTQLSRPDGRFELLILTRRKCFRFWSPQKWFHCIKSMIFVQEQRQTFYWQSECLSCCLLFFQTKNNKKK